MTNLGIQHDGGTGRLLRVEEFAALLNVRPATIRRWVLLRKINYMKVGKSVRIFEGEAQRLMTRVPARCADGR